MGTRRSGSPLRTRPLVSSAFLNAVWRFHHCVVPLRPERICPAFLLRVRQAVALLLLLSLSVHCAGRLGIVAGWWLNQDYIARVLCINRDKPQLKCNGKCHLVKQLKAVEQAERKQQPDSKQAFQEITLFCATVQPLCFTAPAWAAMPLRYADLRVGSYGWDGTSPEHPPA
jgi:hypothetical protein